MARITLRMPLAIAWLTAAIRPLTLWGWVLCAAGRLGVAWVGPWVLVLGGALCARGAVAGWRACAAAGLEHALYEIQ